jgi:ribose 5-phosphate isomerase A
VDAELYPMTDDVVHFKRQAAEYAAGLVQPGMIVGLGHGSTAIWAVRRIAALLRTGQLLDILGVPCSVEVEAEARALGIPLTTLDDHPMIDLTIDGADEIAPNLDVIKGGGGALLREKIVAQATRRQVIVADESKRSPALGTRFAVPVEVVSFGLRTHIAHLESLGARVTLRREADGTPFLTNQGNLILDCAFGPLANPPELAARIRARAGIVEHGLFLGLVAEAVIAGERGIEHVTRASG